MTVRIRLQIQEVELSFLHMIAGLSLRDSGRSSVILERLRVKLLLHIQRRRWLEHLVRVSSGYLLREVLQAWLTGRRHLGKSQDMLERLLVGLGAPWTPPRRAGSDGCGKGVLSLPAQAATPDTQLLEVPRLLQPLKCFEGYDVIAPSTSPISSDQLHCPCWLKHPHNMIPPCFSGDVTFFI